MSVEKAAQTNENNAECALPKDVVTIESSQTKIKNEDDAIKTIEKVDGKQQLVVESNEKHSKELLEKQLKILSQFPEITRAFLFNLVGLPDKEFEQYAGHFFKVIENNRKTSWAIRGAIAFECRKRNESLKSKGGRGSKGKGMTVMLEEVAASVGVSSSTLRDDETIYTAFVEDRLPFELPDDDRNEKRIELIKGLKLNRCFYYRSLVVKEKKDEAIKWAEKRLYETAGEYTESEFIRDLAKWKLSSAVEDIDPEAVVSADTTEIKTEAEKTPFSCELPSELIKFLNKLAGDWGVLVDEALSRLLENHQKLAYPQRGGKI